MVSGPHVWTKPLESKSQALWNQVSESPLGFGDIFDGKATCCRDDELGQDPVVLVHLLDIRALRQGETTTFRLGWSSKLKKNTSKKHHHDPNITPTLWKTWLDSLSKSSLYVLFSGTLSIPLWCRRETQQPPIIFKNCFVQNNHPAVTTLFSKHPSKKSEKLPAKTSPTLVTSTPP